MTYEQGYQDGRKDGSTLLQPINTNGHTYDEYIRIRDKYMAAINTPDPSTYQIGYAVGLDDVAQENLTPEEIEDGIRRYKDEKPW